MLINIHNYISKKIYVSFVKTDNDINLKYIFGFRKLFVLYHKIYSFDFWCVAIKITSQIHVKWRIKFIINFYRYR